ncbi:MAG: tRNA (adenosine(37)-N6)-dimethylallyltransferase MiaA [Muribaculaceae bacterium]|nr:tRNA (adenosine(37)-N6)-dimethylallyltransferase MiaA [Muribaculaceae bacterium]
MNTVVVITGPTGVGKTEAAIKVAEILGCDIINADSRQVYRDIPIGTAAPTAEQRQRVTHHLVACKALDEQYNAWQFENDVMSLLPQLWTKTDHVVMCGGSMMYVDAVCNGIDPLPDIDENVRQAVIDQYEQQGLEPLLAELQQCDPTYFAQVDRQNPRRVLHAVEIFRQSGVPYSTLRTGTRRERPFNIVKVALNIPRPELFNRINKRVDAMMEQGLLDEARRVYPLRHLNSLNTVGYKELFAHFDGRMTLEVAQERIKKNTRVYAKKQLTWLARDTQLSWCAPSETWQVIEDKLNNITDK